MSAYASESFYSPSRIVKQQRDSSSPSNAFSLAYRDGVRQEYPNLSGSSRSPANPTANAIISMQHPHPHLTATMPPQKRAASDDDDLNSATSKHIKTEKPEEFSNAVKKRLQSSSRTGQACDRCKVSAHVVYSGDEPELNAPPDSEDPMRWTSRRMLSMFAEQYRMPDDRSNYG
jgi:hypothetical protein